MGQTPTDPRGIVNSRTPSTSSSTWIVEHLLALLTLGSFAYVWWLLAHFDLDAPVDPDRLPVRIVLAGTLSVVAAIVFWIRMYRDFFRQRPDRNAAAWGVFLFVGAHLAALFWFLLHWRPRHRPRS
jgi:hypothetical protein